jgi:uncharacterized metal-binding protein
MKDSKCAKCKEKPCNEGISEESVLPPYCPIKNYEHLIKKVAVRYKEKDIRPLFLNAALTEKECYDEKAAREKGLSIPLRPRIREVAEFAKKIGAEKIGMAFCIGLADEARRAATILEGHGLNICSVVCSCGSLDKTEVGLPREYKIRNPENFEAACNPLFQAELLNRMETSFNVLIGLCVGHDMLFTQHSKAPVTTLIVKDRFTGHNPVISLYTRYHRHIR